ncbi:MAG TPA: glycosyltransferase family 2 protein [Clostridiaceae bacterium]|jgi:glucosyltransferase|nr:glycosyltransferase GT2 family [Clostridium sp. CAG:452]HJJ04033.1 glycosyltransferase family 2 protein [Clostridiaceae bacterium]
MEKISIVVPCYNEEKNINNFYEEMIKTLEKVKENYSYEIIFVNDGSNDQTEIEVKKVRKTDKNVILISFSRNFGKEAAIYAGLNNATGDLVALIDADLQHPPVTILEMIKGINEGYDVVATKRKNRKGEPVIKSVFSKLFYKMMRMFIPIEKNVQDFRLMKKEVVDAILSLKEYNRFSKGIFTWVGFNIKYIEIENIERKAGKTKWSFKKLFSYAIEGITSFTTAPLKASTLMGFCISIIAIISTIVIILQTLIYGKDVPGYASIITAILFMGGVQLISIGILSEYISKMYLEIKKRPKYIIKEKID